MTQLGGQIDNLTQNTPERARFLKKSQILLILVF